MFCIVGIRPLLCNNRTTVSVSVGAIRLLTHLHSRLEVGIILEITIILLYQKFLFFTSFFPFHFSSFLIFF